MSQTTIPAAITALLSICGTACNGIDTDIVVVDGEPIEHVAPDYVAIIGWEYEQEPATLGGGSPSFQVEENYELTGIIRSFRGESVQADSRTRALDMFAAIQAQIRLDPTLGGAVRVSWLTRGTGKQGATDQGGVATDIEFALHCEARII